MEPFAGSAGVDFDALSIAAVLAGAAMALVVAGAFAPAFVRRIGHGFVLTFIGAYPRSTKWKTGRLDLASARRQDFEEAAARRMRGGSGGTKRAFDIAAALGLLVFFAPLLALTAIAIKLDSRGPVLYRQRRVGIGGREFEIFKFRSMRADAEKDGACWAQANDCRITRVGRFIRRTRIDEIPQAINILRGEMSFVGPRPERPEFVGLLEREIPHYHDRHLVKPGVTGWAQVKYVYTASVEGAREKLAFDLFYVKHSSLLLDMLIVLMTVRVALLGIGSR